MRSLSDAASGGVLLCPLVPQRPRDAALQCQLGAGCEPVPSGNGVAVTCITTGLGGPSEEFCDGRFLPGVIQDLFIYFGVAFSRAG